MSWSPSVCVSARFWSIATLNTSNFTQRSTTAKIFSVVTVETKLGHWSIPIVVEIVTKLTWLTIVWNLVADIATGKIWQKSWAKVFSATVVWSNLTRCIKTGYLGIYFKLIEV